MIKHINFTAKDKVNALAGAASLKEFSAKTIHVVGAALDNATDVETGEVKTVAYLVADNNGERRIISTISGTACESVSAIIDYMTEENLPAVDISVNARKSNGGREFLTLTVGCEGVALCLRLSTISLRRATKSTRGATRNLPLTQRAT